MSKKDTLEERFNIFWTALWSQTELNKEIEENRKFN